MKIRSRYDRHAFVFPPKMRRVGSLAEITPYPVVMAYEPLPNYLRTYRKRMGLSAKDVAFLLRTKSASHISRYEHFHRTPSTRNRLHLMSIFQREMDELFPGEYAKAERRIIRRARLLHDQIASSKNMSLQTAHKLRHLKALAEVRSARRGSQKVATLNNSESVPAQTL
jgi:transcriptional regulator with XRE-family HTH domain